MYISFHPSSQNYFCLLFFVFHFFIFVVNLHTQNALLHPLRELIAAQFLFGRTVVDEKNKEHFFVFCQICWDYPFTIFHLGFSHTSQCKAFDLNNEMNVCHTCIGFWGMRVRVFVSNEVIKYIF